MELQDAFLDEVTRDNEMEFLCTVELIAAVGRNGVIGNNNKIPWHYPEDLEHFKNRTMDSTLIMGRKTHDSVVTMADGPLEDREHLVLTTQSEDDILYGSDPSVTVFNDVESLVTYITVFDSDDKYYVIGGETVYDQFLPYATHIRLTYVPESPEGDTYFPEFNPLDWEVIDDEKSSLDNGLQFVTYKRRS